MELTRAHYMQVSQLRTVVSFAGNLPQRVSQGVFAELNEIYNAVA